MVVKQRRPGGHSLDGVMPGKAAEYPYEEGIPEVIRGHLCVVRAHLPSLRMFRTMRPEFDSVRLDSRGAGAHTGSVLQLIFKSEGDENGSSGRPEPATLGDLDLGQTGVLESFDVPEDVARRLMQLGFLPGSTVVAARSAPGGDPRVFQVDGAEVALRRETATQIRLRRNGQS